MSEHLTTTASDVFPLRVGEVDASDAPDRAVVEDRLRRIRRGAEPPPLAVRMRDGVWTMADDDGWLAAMVELRWQDMTFAAYATDFNVPGREPPFRDAP